jgi:three-Cys-motif partner protein
MAAMQFGGDWTTEKLGRLRSYLAAYTTILRRQTFTFAYIDAFAGSGYREPKGGADEKDWFLPGLDDVEQRSFLQGSAQIALECDPPFHKYVFIEKDEKTLAKLQKNLSQRFPEKKRNIIFQLGDANTVIQDLCKRDWRWHRAVLFLDPFGMQVVWSTIEAVAETRAIDLWILFPLGVGVNRMLTRDGQMDASWKRKLNDIFGQSDWYDLFYSPASQPSFFHEDTMQKTANFSVILAYYVNRLRSIFPHVAENPLQLYNTRNNPLYALFFAAGNPKGGETAVKIAQYILGK